MSFQPFFYILLRCVVEKMVVVASILYATVVYFAPTFVNGFHYNLLWEQITLVQPVRNARRCVCVCVSKRTWENFPFVIIAKGLFVCMCRGPFCRLSVCILLLLFPLFSVLFLVCIHQHLTIILRRFSHCVAITLR